MTQYGLPIPMLIDLAQRRHDAQTRELGAEQAARAQAFAQLEALRSYKDDYQRDIQAALRAGLNAGSLRDYAQFVATLETAIAQQGALLREAELRLERARAGWRSGKRRLAAFESLASRRVIAQYRVDAKRAQTEQDEFARRCHMQS